MLQPHIQLDETVNAQCALLPGDPARLDRIAPFLSEVQELAYNREFRSLRGLYKGLPVLAISTGEEPQPSPTGDLGWWRKSGHELRGKSYT
jgi:uridine phosphorylase